MQEERTNPACEFDPRVEDIWRNPLYLIRRTIASAIKDHAHNLRNDILDYGCGNKPYEWLFDCTNYVGVDIEVSGHPNSNKRADYFFDGHQLPFADNSFDGVLASEVFEHVFDLDQALSEISRVLRPGGKLLATCPFVWSLHEQPYDYARYTPYALVSILNRLGFSEISVSKRGSEVETIAQLLIIEIVLPLIRQLPLPGRINRAISRGVVGVIALTARFCSRWTRTERDLYLTNLIVATKPVSQP